MRHGEEGFVGWRWIVRFAASIQNWQLFCGAVARRGVTG
jgi:hypothetical protein